MRAGRFLRTLLRRRREAGQLPVYWRALENWPGAWYHARSKSVKQPLVFRSGIVWHSGPHDDANVLFREIFVRRHYPLLPRGGPVLDIGANISMLWACDREDVAIHAYEPNPAALETCGETSARTGSRTASASSARRWGGPRGRSASGWMCRRSCRPDTARRRRSRAGGGSRCR